ncbi:EthD domain-containing protein [Cladophialophora immunda]|nr:EthD domain-containing protein [Cladophialophora immunda]
MAFTTIPTVSKAPHLTAEQFRHHYENVHVPLVYSLSDERARPLVYRRHYVQRPTEGLASSARKFPDYDVMTVVVFADVATYEAWMASLAAGSNPQTIADDAKRF